MQIALFGHLVGEMFAGKREFSIAPAAPAAVIGEGSGIYPNKSAPACADALCSVGVPGLEPGKTGPESVVLPITPYPNVLS